MYQKKKPQLVLIGTWKFYQKGALLGDFIAVTGITVTNRETDRLAELIYKILNLKVSSLNSSILNLLM
jgi:hypothetical protein